MTHLSSHDISSANSGHSQPLLSLRSARWLWPSVKIPPDDTGYQRHLYRLQNIGPANARYLGTNQQSSDFDIGESQNSASNILQTQSEIFFYRKKLCVRLQLIHICGQPVIFSLFLLSREVRGCSFEPSRTGVVSVLNRESGEWVTQARPNPL